MKKMEQVDEKYFKASKREACEEEEPTDYSYSLVSPLTLKRAREAQRDNRKGPQLDAMAQLASANMRVFYEFEALPPPKNLWDHEGLDEVMDLQCLEENFDEELRCALEEAQRHRHKPCEELDMRKVGRYLDKCNDLIILKFTMSNISESDSHLEESIKDSIKPFTLELEDGELTTRLFQNNSELQWLRTGTKNEGTDEPYAAQGMISVQAIKENEFDLYRKSSESQEKVRQCLNRLLNQYNYVDGFIKHMIKSKSGGLIPSFLRMADQHKNIDEKLEKIVDLKKKLSSCVTSLSHIRRIGSQTKLLDRKKQLLEDMKRAKDAFSKIVRYCNLDIINAQVEELPVIYEVLLIFWLNLNEETFQGVVEAIRAKTLSLVIDRLSVIKKRLKGLLFTLLIEYNEVYDPLEEDSRPPDKQLVQLLMAYTGISETAKKHLPKSQTPLAFEEDKILLKSDCLQLFHLDDSLSCIHNSVVRDFF